MDVRAINLLARNYNILDYSKNLVALLKTTFPTQDFEHFTKYELHKLLSDTLLQNYNGEEVLKYKLSQQYFNKQNIIAAFEIKVNNSRVDFLTINGYTTSFEIKSELDSLDKAKKQLADYMLVFEYNYLAIDERHKEKINDILPESFGLLTYKNGKYKKQKNAVSNNNINPEVQLNILNKQELIIFFPEMGGRISDILKSADSNYINSQFKKALKNRYRSRWEFIVANKSQILPIDLQFFFNTNILPSHIYNH